MRELSGLSRLPVVFPIAAATCLLALLAPPLAQAADPPFAPGERRELIDSGRAEARVLDAFDAQERVPVLVLLALPAESRAPRAAAWAERGAERAAIAAAADRVLAQVGGELELRYRYRSAPLLAGVISRGGLRRLVRDADVAQVGLDEGGSAALLGAVPHVDLDLARAVYPGAGVTVAVIDSGIDASHPDLADALVGEACFCNGCCPGGVSRVEGPGSAADDFGHGTAVSGVITSEGTLAPLGGAPDAAIVAVKIINAEGFFLNLSDPFAALDWVTNERPDVDLVNMSFGTGQLFEGDCDGTLQGIAFGYWTDQLRANGVLSFAAAHNQGSATSMSSPACVAGVISVASVYENGNARADEITDFSNRSETTDVLAPGSDIDTTGLMADGGVYLHWAGTSFSTPLALACAATLLESNPGLDPDLLEAALESSSTRVVDPDNGFDYPRVDCEEAHAYVRGACADALDNDRDGASDLDDAGCPFPESRPENPACDDGLDNDGDGLVDWDDPACTATWPYSEKRACGLGAELVLLGALAPLLATCRSKRSR